jgi:hypothetical protein
MELADQAYKSDLWVRNLQQVRTKRGADFVGTAIARYYNPVMQHWGVVVMATWEGFKGCVHVYPVMQLEEITQ